VTFIIDESNDAGSLSAEVGGKARGLLALRRGGFRVPTFFVVAARAFDQSARAARLHLSVAPGADLPTRAREIEAAIIGAPLPADVRAAIVAALKERGLLDVALAVRSSGLDEDSALNSFAGQFSSYLFQRGEADVIASLKLCWASAFSARALAYRKARHLPLGDSRVAVVVQRMVDAEVAGVAFSRNVVHPLDRETLLVSSVFGLGEGLVSGALDADEFTVARDLKTIRSTLAKKTAAVRARSIANGGGIETVPLAAEQTDPSLTDAQVREVGKLALDLERALGAPQDCEWAYASGELHVLQSRPITSLPNDAFFERGANGDELVLWDNSNIIESFCGLTSPLTFSHAARSYKRVYRQSVEILGVPPDVVAENEPLFANMLGLVRGRIYYNLVNWYRILFLLPGAGTNRGFMETMMGVRQSLTPEQEKLFDFAARPPRYSSARRLVLMALGLKRILAIDATIRTFTTHVSAEYERTRKLDMDVMSIRELTQLYATLEETITGRWQAPILNDLRCMIFFGLLRSLTTKWVTSKGGGDSAALQNDLLCGTGDLESIMPTRMLMTIAASVDGANPEVRTWFMETPPSELIADLRARRKSPAVGDAFADFIDRYGFRCVNELKLEEPDLHDDPSFAIDAVRSYVKMKAYAPESMEERERSIRAKGEALVRARVAGVRRSLFFWVLSNARRAVRDREQLRFIRTKVFGLVRMIFRAIGRKLAKMGMLEDGCDVFYLTVDEISAFADGRAVTNDLGGMAALRKREYDTYRDGGQPPDRFFTRGAPGASAAWGQILADGLLGAPADSGDPNVLTGTPCCPGVVEGAVRVVHSMEDAKGMAGEILVTERTDPGWVPLYPSCSGLLIERGSLLSHSAVVARELGLPTIVGITGGLVRKLKTGDRVAMDGGRGEIRIVK
jgi:phosphohistidine swiveling domain-containing protein